MKPHRRGEAAWLVAAAILLLALLPTGYFVAYYLTIRVAMTTGIAAEKVPFYAVGDWGPIEPIGAAWPDRLFRPAHRLDRLLRPGTWNPDAQVLLMRNEFRKLLQRQPPPPNSTPVRGVLPID